MNLLSVAVVGQLYLTLASCQSPSPPEIPDGPNTTTAVSSSGTNKSTILLNDLILCAFIDHKFCIKMAETEHWSLRRKF